MTRNFYDPSQETLTSLDVPWICNYSGGKDSTSLVTWMEYLRRSGWVTCSHPRLVMSDTTVEYPFLRDTSERLMGLLRQCGWSCDVVMPLVQHRLYCQIFGRGLPPVLPSWNRMRWCTRSTKIDPMKRFRSTLGTDTLSLTGMRWGESQMRDEKLLKSGCVAGGECGLTRPGNDTFAAIINWTDCQVVDWLSGVVGKRVRELMSDVFDITKHLLDVYNVKVTRRATFLSSPPKITMMRFGCIGRPAVERDKVMDHAAKTDPSYRYLRGIYRIWRECRERKNRVCRRKDGRVIKGPLTMAARQYLYGKLLDIQGQAGIQIVSAEDDAFIRQCWRFGQTRKVNCHLVYGEGERNVVSSMLRKDRASDEMYAGIVRHINDAADQTKIDSHNEKVSVPTWLKQ